MICKEICHHQICKWPPKNRRSSRDWNNRKWYSMLVCLVKQQKDKFYYQQSSNCLPCSVFHQPHFSIAILCDCQLLSRTQTQVCTWVLARVNFYMCHYNQCHASSLKNASHASVSTTWVSHVLSHGYTRVVRESRASVCNVACDLYRNKIP